MSADRIEQLSDDQKALHERVLGELLACYGEGGDTDWPWLNDLVAVVASLIEREHEGLLGRLRAVTELHQPITVEDFARRRRVVCADCWTDDGLRVPHPCPTFIAASGVVASETADKEGEGG